MTAAPKYRSAPADYVGTGLFDRSTLGVSDDLAVGERVIHPIVGKLPPFDQGPIGDCETNSWCRALEAQMAEPIPLSRLDLYWRCCAKDGSLENLIDAGTTSSTVIDVLQETGVAREALWPYVVENARVRPPLACLEDGFDHRIDAAERIVSHGIERQRDVIASLRAGRVKVIGGPVSQPYLDYFDGAQTGLVAWSDFAHPIGGHAQALVGAWRVSELEVLFLVETSWGGGGLAEFPGCAWYRLSALDLQDELYSVSRAPKV